ncbi:hypothetical protein GSI_13202 [Ganoderma sinense ZZ0214-1]|uniref:Uncharacterized protein n=1 Tax=Ganoderma sinense ZZ0214-1 TaxID=1077348 RepID=A0A2G8RUY1_9APHY|nr:hypothetical protein GSI_13202 [Ganoderma sinense ZZ0214-1]
MFGEWPAGHHVPDIVTAVTTPRDKCRHLEQGVVEDGSGWDTSVPEDRTCGRGRKAFVLWAEGPHTISFGKPASANIFVMLGRDGMLPVNGKEHGRPEEDMAEDQGAVRRVLVFSHGRCTIG